MKQSDPNKIDEIKILVDNKVIGKLLIAREYRDKIVQSPYGVCFIIDKKTKTCVVHDRTQQEERLDQYLFENFNTESRDV